jgi:thioredoxin 1
MEWNFSKVKDKSYHMTIKLTTEDFKNKVFDYTSNQEWKYAGKLPAIIDFYADWCGPCKMVAPLLEELSKQYEDKVLIYKVDTEAEQELSGVFGIRSIPSFLFIPMEGQPMMQAGALPKNVFEQVIEEHLMGVEKQPNEGA